MTKTFTQDDVIRYIYGEVSETEAMEIKQALLCDIELQDIYKEYITVKMQLDESFKIPSDKVTETILNYSKSLDLQSEI